MMSLSNGTRRDFFNKLTLIGPVEQHSEGGPEKPIAVFPIQTGCTRVIGMQMVRSHHRNPKGT
jgi:hypothetical protein